MSGEIWGLLGSLQFKAVDSPDSFSVAESESFAEIPLIQEKAVTQWVGPDLRRLRMSFSFDYSWCIPSAKLAELQELLAAHEPLAFSFGEGNYNANYLLMSIDETVTKTLPTGEILELSVRVTLQETTEEPVDDGATEATDTGTIANPFERVRAA